MIITWTNYLARRKIGLNDIVKAYGYNYAQLSSYFLSLGVTVPDRDEPQVVEVFGPPLVEATIEPPPETTPPPAKPQKLRKRVDASMKDTKKSLLKLAVSLNLAATDKMTKANILDMLTTSEKVNVIKVKTTRKNNKG